MKLNAGKVSDSLFLFGVWIVVVSGLVTVYQRCQGTSEPQSRVQYGCPSIGAKHPDTFNSSELPEGLTQHRDNIGSFGHLSDLTGAVLQTPSFSVGEEPSCPFGQRPQPIEVTIMIVRTVRVSIESCPSIGDSY